MRSLGNRLVYVFILLFLTVAMIIKFPPEIEHISENGIVFINYLAILGISISAITMLLLIFVGTDNIRLYAVIMLIGFGLCFIIALPPFSRPDEEFHYNTSLALSNILLGEKDTQYTEREYLKTDDFPQHYVTSEAYLEEIRDLTGEDEVDDAKIRTASDRYYAINHPVDYLASSIGITLGRVFRLRFTQTFWLGCFLNLLCYVALVMLAMRLFPRLKEVFLLVAAIPMNLHQAASFSYDSILLGMSFVFAAYVFYLYFEAKRVTWKETLILTGISALFFPIKIVYLTMIIIFWVTPGDKFESVKDRIVKIITVTIIPVFITMVLRFADIIGSSGSSAAYMPGISMRMVTLYSVHDMVSDPMNTTKVFIVSVYKEAWDWLMTAFGYKMAGLSLYISTYYIYAIIILLLIAVWYYSASFPRQTLFFRGAAILSGLIGSLLIMTAMLLYSTDRYSDTIQGIQGRYYMPFLIPIIACVHTKSHSKKTEAIINSYNIFFLWGLMMVGVVEYVFFRNSL